MFNFIIKSLFLFLIFNFLFFDNVCYSYTSDENDCIVNILKTLGVFSEFPPTLNGNTQIDFCKFSSNFTCDYGDGISIPYSGVNSIKLRQIESNNNIISWSDIQCLNFRLNEMTLKEWRLSSDFLLFAINSGVKYLTIDGCYGVTNLNYKFSLLLGFYAFIREPIESPIFLSNIIGIYEFIIEPFGPLKNYSNSVILVNDIPIEKPTEYYYKFSIPVRSIPTMSNIYGSKISITLGYPFNYSSLINLSTYSNFDTISFPAMKTPNTYIPFPIYPETIMDKPILNTNYKFTTLEILNMLEKPTDYINTINSFLGSNNSATYWNLNNVGPLFNIDGNLPFKNFPPMLISLVFSGGNLINVPDFNDNNKYPESLKFIQLSKNFIGNTLKSNWSKNGLLELNLSDNNITGTIDDSYCSVLLNVRNNKLSGPLPLCYLCNLRIYSFMSRFQNNNFSNFNDSTTNCKVIPNMKFYFSTQEKDGVIVSTISKCVIFGENLGYGLNSGQSLNIQFQPTVSSIFFEKQNSFLTIKGYNAKRTIHKVKFPNSDQIFYLTPDPYQPTPINATRNGNSISINGLYFSYNTSVINISLNNGEKNCFVYGDPTFYNINCELSNGLPTVGAVNLKNVPIVLKVDELSTLFYMNMDDLLVNNYTSCLDYCNGENGVCNYSNGQCQCNILWTGLNCSTPLHYVSSVIPSSINGGLVILNGWFGDEHKNLTIKIGQLDCLLQKVNSSTIECFIGAGYGVHNITIVQNDQLWHGIKVYLYYSVDTNYPCYNDCTGSNKGTCNTSNGECNCKIGWAGLDCSSPSIIDDDDSNSNSLPPLSIPSSNKTVSNDGKTIIYNQHTKYEIQIVKLLEIDIEKNIVKQYELENNWVMNKSDTGSTDNISKFSQKLDNTNCLITLSIEEVVENDKQYKFAGLEFLLEKGSVKVSILIENYNYKSNLNTIQLQFKSSVSSADKEQDCNFKETQISTDFQQTSLFNYVTLSKNNKIMFSRFLNRVVSDNIPTFITNTLINADSTDDYVIVALNLPHFISSCLIDSDYSSHITSDFKLCDHDGNEKRKSYVIPVAIVVSVVGAILIGSVIFYFYLKKKGNSKLMDKLKLKTFKK